jgi:3-oxosteroid 1-dehydrogenase
VTVNPSFDIVVMGSGAAGLTAALAAAVAGARVLALEKTALVGGTTAISGGQLWVPGHRLMAPAGDSLQAAAEYLAAVTLDEVPPTLVAAFLQGAAPMVATVEAFTPLRFFQVDRPDYHSAWPGAAHGRSIEPLPLDVGILGPLAACVRRSPYRLALTSAEAKAGHGRELSQARDCEGLVTQGVALVAGLLQGCVTRGVTVRCEAAVRSFTRLDDGTLQLHVAAGNSTHAVHGRSLVIASGGFEWHPVLKRAFLAVPDDGAASPPGNEGDGLRIGLAAGAAVAQMTQAWWSAAYRIPGELYDGQPLVRNIVRELALPGSILVNADGRRFANEAASYNALGKAFQHFDPQRNRYPNRRAWLVFDDDFKRRYAVASIAPTAEAPPWFLRGESAEELARRGGIEPQGLLATLARFNALAESGHDLDFHRGETRHDAYHGDATRPHPNLAPILRAPFYAVPIFLGNLGTKGGLQTNADGEVLDLEGRPLPGLYACGNAAASWMGPGYPGAGGSLGPIMTAAHLCGAAAARAAAAASSFEGSGDGRP